MPDDRFAPGTKLGSGSARTGSAGRASGSTRSGRSAAPAANSNRRSGGTSSGWFSIDEAVEAANREAGLKTQSEINEERQKILDEIRNQNSPYIGYGDIPLGDLGDFTTRLETLPGGEVYDAPFTPRYVFGDEARYRSAPREVILAWQADLVAAGFLDPEQGDWTRGVWDPTTEGQYMNLLAIANTRGLTDEQALDYIKRQGGYGGALLDFGDSGRGRGGGGGGGGIVTRVSNPDDLRAGIRQAVYNATGGVFISDDEIDAMVNGLQQLERDTQAAAAAGGEIVDPPSLETYVGTQLDEVDVGGEQAGSIGNFANILMRIAAGGDV